MLTTRKNHKHRKQLNFTGSDFFIHYFKSFFTSLMLIWKALESCLHLWIKHWLIMSLRVMCILGVNRVWSGVPYSGLIQVKMHSVGWIWRYYKGKMWIVQEKNNMRVCIVEKVSIDCHSLFFFFTVKCIGVGFFFRYYLCHLEFFGLITFLFVLIFLVSYSNISKWNKSPLFVKLHTLNALSVVTIVSSFIFPVSGKMHIFKVATMIFNCEKILFLLKI